MHCDPTRRRQTAAAVKWGYKSCVVRTPDTDILMILLYHATKINLSIYLDHDSGKHCIIINVTELSESLGPDYSSTLLGFYVFTGEDCASAFKGKGKVNPLKKLQQHPKLQNAFRQLGADWLVTDELQLGWGEDRRGGGVGTCLDNWTHPPVFSC